MESQIPTYVINAQKHINDFLAGGEDDVFPMALGILEEKLGITKADCKKVVNTFLDERKIHPDPAHDQMLKMPEQDVNLLGMAYYFARKGIQTSYDIKMPDSTQDYTNPLPLIKNTFAAVKPFDNNYAYTFLNSIRQLMAGKHNEERQRHVMVALMEVLPDIVQQYNDSAGNLPSGKSHTPLRTKLNDRYKLALDRFVDYLKMTIAAGTRPAIMGYDKFAETIGENRGRRLVSGMSYSAQSFGK